MLGGWVRYLQLTAKAKTGFSPALVVFAIIAMICAATAFVLLVFTAFIWLAEHYRPLTAGIILTLFFLFCAVLAGVAVVVTQRRTVSSANAALQERANKPWFDPATVGIMLQVGRGIGLRRVVPLLAAGLLAAGFAREWLRDRSADEVASDEEAES
jgi:hypothetical protein